MAGRPARDPLCEIDSPDLVNSARSFRPLKQSLTALVLALGLVADSQGLLPTDHSGQFIFLALCTLIILAGWKGVLEESRGSMAVTIGLVVLVLVSLWTAHRPQVPKSGADHPSRLSESDLNALVEERQNQVASRSSRSEGRPATTMPSSTSTPDNQDRVYLDFDRPAYLKPGSQDPDLVLNRAGTRLVAYRDGLVAILRHPEIRPSGQCSALASPDMGPSLPIVELVTGAHFCLRRAGNTVAIMVIERSPIGDANPWLHLQFV
jgi:hypothetical protein